MPKKDLKKPLFLTFLDKLIYSSLGLKISKNEWAYFSEMM
jgi:hypothetical protein